MIEADDKLVQEGLIDETQLSAARVQATQSGATVWFVLVKLGYLSEEQVMVFLARQCGIPYVSLSDYRISRDVLGLLDEHFCRQNAVIPLFKINGVLSVACSNPLDSALLDAVGKMSGCVVEPLMASYSSVRQAVEYYWNLDSRQFDVAGFIARSAPVKGLAYGRQSERLPLFMTVRISPYKGSFTLSAAKDIKGECRDLSADGRSLGLYSPVYLPAGADVLIDFEAGVGVQAQVIHCQMIKSRWYLLGAKLMQLDPERKERLLSLARKINNPK